jgi:hypothetical protein
MNQICDLPDVDPVDDVQTLDDYMQRYGNLLGRQIRERLKPLHTPGTDPLLEAESLRKPFEAQAHVITAGVKHLRRNKALILCGEMGTGKTLIGQLVAHAHAGGAPYRGLVFCPPHLVKKWARELTETIPLCVVHVVDNWADLCRLRSRQAPQGSEWWVISQNTAKLGPSWEPAYATRRVCNGHRNREHIYCPTCTVPLEQEKADTDVPEPLTPADLKRSKKSCENCGSPLWQWAGKVRRWPGASYVSRQLRGVFDYLIIDEAHQEKGANTAQGNAAGTLAASCRKVIAMTGTLIGGQADHLRTLLYRLNPTTQVVRGLEWSAYMPFSERYGRIERRVTRDGKRDYDTDNRCSRGSTGKTAKYVRPGVMPTLFSEHLVGQTIFISLQEVADHLPPLEETLHPIPMDGELQAAYDALESTLTGHVKQMAAKGDRRLLGAMLQALLCYPDKPFGWNEIGYRGREDEWIPVVSPQNLDPAVVRPKEQALIGECLREKREGRQVWVFTTMTDQRDVCERLRVHLMCSGLRTMILRSSVEPREREAWIQEWGPQCDVVISHPQLVETGLELFDKGGAHNFCTLLWYLTGYNLFTLRQASARAFRIGQQRECRTKFFFYEGTMQARAMTLMGQKLSAAQAIEGKFSSEGLVAMAGEEGSMEMALAKSLVDKITDSADAVRAWAKVTGAPVLPPIQPAEEFRMLVPQHAMAATARPQRPVIYRPVKKGQVLMDFRPQAQLALLFE